MLEVKTTDKKKREKKEGGKLDGCCFSSQTRRQTDGERDGGRDGRGKRELTATDKPMDLWLADRRGTLTPIVYFLELYIFFLS